VWIRGEWQHISPEVTMKGFKKWRTSNALDGTDDDMLWSGTEEDGNVRSACEEYEGTDCEDSVADCLCTIGWKEPSLLIEWRAGLVPELVDIFCRREKDLDLARMAHMYNNDIIILHCFPVLVPILIINFLFVVLSSFTSHWVTVISFHTFKTIIPMLPYRSAHHLQRWKNVFK